MGARLRSAAKGARLGAKAGSHDGSRAGVLAGIGTAGLIRGVAGKHLSPDAKGLAKLGGATAVGTWAGATVSGATIGAYKGARHPHAAVFHATKNMSGAHEF